MRKTLKRDLIAVIWTLLVTYAIGKWAFHLAYIERGYEAVGGEYLLILAVYWGAWKAINCLFDSLEEYVRSLAFSKFTMDLCRTLRDMEKEHSIRNQSAPTDNHIVAVPAL